MYDRVLQMVLQNRNANKRKTEYFQISRFPYKPADNQ